MDDAVKIKKRTGKNGRPRRAGKQRSARKYFYLPELQRTRPGSELFGYACRALAAWLAVWGLLLFINDAFLFGADAGFLAAASFLPVALLSVALLNRLGAFIAFGGAAASAAIYVSATKNPIIYAREAAVALYNSVCLRLSGLGYRSPGEIGRSFAGLPSGTDTPDLLKAGLAFVGILLAIIITLSVVKRVRMLPITVAGGVICVFVFTYNLSDKSWGFTLMLTALCGLTVMRAYENFLREAPEQAAKRGKKPRRGRAGKTPDAAEQAPAAPEPAARPFKANENGRPRSLFNGSARGSALGGFAGLAAMAVAFAVLLFPTLSITKKWEEIESINSKMEIARQIVSSVIIGDVPDFSDLGYLGQMDLLTSRSTTASERLFTGAKAMEVRSNYNLPIYLRSFVSETYDNDKWYAPQKYDISYFKQTFGEDFSGEDVARSFYNLVSPKLTQLNNYDNYVSRIEYGYVTTPVDIRLLSSAGNLLFLPSRYDPTVGLLAHGGAAGDAYAEDYASYSDGIISTSWFNFNKAYRALTYIQSYRHEDVFQNLAALDACYRICRRYIEETMVDPQIDRREEVKEAINSLCLDDYADNNAYERWYALDAAGREQFYSQYLKTDEYNKYAREKYTYVTNTEQSTLTVLALTALGAKYPELGINSKNIDDFLYSRGDIISVIQLELTNINKSPFEKTMAVIDYLNDNYAYTLNPKEPRPRYSKLSSVDTFLFDTKEGYCVQFATAAALMLRTLGVPTRYCEGYIATDFKLNKSSGGAGRYTSMVRDFNAHAWIEIYVDNLGWLTFETTPEYYSGMYEHYSTSGNYSSGDYNPPEYIPPDDIGDAAAQNKGKLDLAGFLTVLAVGLACAAALGAAVYFVYRFAAASRDALYRREDFIGRALRHTLEGGERRAAAVAVIDYIASALAVAGLRPRVGELPSEFRDRCGRVLRGEEPAKTPDPRKIKLPEPLARLNARLAALLPKKGSAASKIKAKKPRKPRSGSLGVADEFTGAKNEEYKPEPADAVQDAAAPDYAAIFGAIQREEFGDGMAPGDLRGCAEFLVALSDNIYGKLNPPEKFWFRHVRHAI